MTHTLYHNELGEPENHGFLTWRRPFGSKPIETVRRHKDIPQHYWKLLIVKPSCTNERHLYAPRTSEGIS